MTDNKDLKYNTPKTYEVRYVENKEPGKLVKLASYLGIKTAECSSKSSGKEVSNTSSTTITATKSTQAEIVASAIETTAKVGGSVEIKTKSSGKTTINYDSGKAAK